MAHLMCFIGIDGSGKTSHIQKIIASFSRTCSCQIVRCGAAIRFLTYPFYLLCRLLGLTENYDEKSKHFHTSRYPLVYKNKVIALIWPYLVFFDMFILVLFRIKIRLMLGKTIFSDRGLHDVIVEIMIATGDYTLYKGKFAKLLLNLVKPDLVIMLNVSEEDAMKRKNDVPNVEFLRIRKSLYLNVASYHNINVIDANRSFSEVHCDVESFVKPLLQSSRG